MSVLKWIFNLVERIYGWLKPYIQFVHGIFSSVLSWVIAGIIYVVHLLVDYVGDFFEGLFENLTEISLQGVPVSPFANWLAKMVALDTAWECLWIYLLTWFAVKIARSSFSAVRLILDII